MFLAVLSKQDVRLSRYELERLAHSTSSNLIDGHLLLFEGLRPDAPVQRLAFTRRILKVLCRTAPNKLETALDKLDLNRVVKSTFAARMERSSDRIPNPFDERRWGDLVWRRLTHPRADLTRPETTIVLFLTKTHWYVCTHIWTSTERFEERRNHFLPEPHPTGLHPRLARALVNILDTQSFLDPFCGAGGILIEGALAGKKVEGSDIDRIQVGRARTNLAHFGFVNVPLHVRDALTLKKKAEGIITDLPYGKNSRLAGMQATYADFLRTASNITGRMVICVPGNIDEKMFLARAGWKKEASFLRYLHRSLSKRILVLSR